mgnify:CR=1 FL=1
MHKLKLKNPCVYIFRYVYVLQEVIELTSGDDNEVGANSVFTFKSGKFSIMNCAMMIDSLRRVHLACGHDEKCYIYMLKQKLVAQRPNSPGKIRLYAFLLGCSVRKILLRLCKHILVCRYWATQRILMSTMSYNAYLRFHSIQLYHETNYKNNNTNSK